MKNSIEQIVIGVPQTTKGHFVLYLYAAVHRFIYYIHQLRDVGGPTLDRMFEKYPFLAKYYEEMRRHMPDGIDWSEGVDWWRREIDVWENDCRMQLPLQAIVIDGLLGFENCLAFMLVGLAEEDSRFGTVFSELQAPLIQRRPSLELIGRVISGVSSSSADPDPLALSRPLLNAGLIEVINKQSPRSEWLLRVPTLLWDIVSGEMDDTTANGFRHYLPDNFPTTNELIYPKDLLERLNRIPKLIEDGTVSTIVFRGDHGADPIEVMGSLARSMDRGLIVIDGGSSFMKDQEARQIGPLCTMTYSMPMFRYDLGPGETIEMPKFSGYKGAIFLALGFEGGVNDHRMGKMLTVTLPGLDRQLRERCWHRALGGSSVDNLDTITRLYHISGGYISQLADMAVAQAGLNGRDTVVLSDVQEASRALNRQHLDTLAERLPTRGSWNDMVVTETTAAKLQELEQRCRYREQLLDQLSPAFSNSARGVRALFSGASGTGKTLAAKILAAELGVDIYRVDLAAIINKYIGETEKNLHQVLARAESLDVILLLDEGDALLGQRTDVKSANDRYANLETNYLLQRLEHYQGIIIVTTNLVENVDRAFQRRMDVVVPFLPPQVEERFHILQLHLPSDHQLDFDYLQQVASRCTLNGGQIRNVALHATLLATGEGATVKMFHIEEALRSEYRKAGAMFPLVDVGNGKFNRDGGMEAFVNALGSQ